MDNEGFRALADNSNAACARIGDAVWSLHTDALDASVKITPSNRDALITKMNDELTYCGVTNWQLPSQQQISAITLEPTLPFTVHGKSDEYSDYWLNKKDSYGSNHRFDTRRLMDTKGSTSSTHFRAIGTATGEVQNPLPTPDAPTAAGMDDALNTFAWDYVSGYNNDADYEFSINNGETWTDATANPIAIGAVFGAAGDLHIRVKATAENKFSNSLVSTEHFLSDTQFNCVGGDSAAVIEEKCFIKFNDAVSWDGAKTACSALTPTMSPLAISDTTDKMQEIAVALNLQTSDEFWLNDERDSYWGHTIDHRSSGWYVDYESKGSNYKYICVN